MPIRVTGGRCSARGGQGNDLEPKLISVYERNTKTNTAGVWWKREAWARPGRTLYQLSPTTAELCSQHTQTPCWQLVLLWSAGSPLGSSADLHWTCSNVWCFSGSLLSKEGLRCGSWGSAPHGTIISRLAGPRSYGDGRGPTGNPQCARLVQASACII